MLHVLAPQAREHDAYDRALPPASAPADTPLSETIVGISKTDDNTLIIRIRLPETRTIVLSLSGMFILATGIIALRKRNRHHAASPHTIESAEIRKCDNTSPSPIATADTAARHEETDDETTPAIAAIPLPEESERPAETDKSAMNEEIDGIDLPLLTPPSGSDTHMLQRLNEFIARHINEVDLSVNDLAAAVYMSRSNLFRRLKTLYGITPNEYLRRKRLLYAAALLRQNKYNISDVCFMVGFSSPSYFASCFKKHFGVLPKNYIR